MTHTSKKQLTFTACGLALLAAPAQAVESNPEKNVYFGTTHGHSSWSVDAFALGLPPSDLVPATIQERAWSSPIWYAGVAAKQTAEAGAHKSPPHTGHLPLVEPKND